MARAFAAVVLTVALAGCLPASPVVPAPDGPPFDPAAFFIGETRGFGVLTIRGRAPEVIEVVSLGALVEGGVRLDQTIRGGDNEPTERSWTLRATAPDTWTGPLSDADGIVTATLEGGALHIRYRMGRLTTMEQWLTLEPDGQAALNVATVRMMGVPVARLVERIRRIGE